LPVETATQAISNCEQLQNMKNKLDGNYYLTSNIDCSVSKGWNGGLGFEPIGRDMQDIFYGKLDGKGYSISNLYINRPDENNVGLFAKVYNAPLINFTLLNVNITGWNYVGGIAGLREMNDPLLSNVNVTGSVIGLTLDKVKYIGSLYGKDIYNGPHI
jgi:hypothetical protein